MTTTQNLQIRKFHGIVTVADGSKFSAVYWVGMRLPAAIERDDAWLVKP